jgi:hypothetical protein
MSLAAYAFSLGTELLNLSPDLQRTQSLRLLVPCYILLRRRGYTQYLFNILSILPVEKPSRASLLSISVSVPDGLLYKLATGHHDANHDSLLRLPVQKAILDCPRASK